MYSFIVESMPLIAWRSWEAYSAHPNTLTGMFMQNWSSRVFDAVCRFHDHIAPHATCTCGIYAHTKLALNQRYYRRDAFHLFFGVLTGGFALIFIASIFALLSFGSGPLVYFFEGVLGCFAAFFIICFMFANIAYLVNLFSPRLYGAVALSGKILYYPPHGVRAQRARIVLLIRPRGFCLREAKAIARYYNVPLFEAYEKVNIAKYLSEHGVDYSKLGLQHPSQP